MNCANHADASAVAYCRTCGKALCANCTRPVRGVIYCEDCLGAKMEGTTAPGSARFVPPPIQPPVVTGRIPPPPPASSSGPNPTVAGILAGFFPFGVGAVYTGQYAKGLAHLAIFGLLVAGCSVENSEALPVICGFGLAFFYVYQIIDSVRSARAIQAGLPAPDPYGLAATFGSGRKVETSKIPLGAIILILLGVLFLLHTMGWGLGFDRFWPLLLIVAGGWMFARAWGLAGADCAGGCQCAHCRSARLMGPAVVMTLGVLFLFGSLGRVGFGRTWPILLLVIGGVKLFQSSASREGHLTLPPSGPPPADSGTPPAPSATPSEVSHG
jgi:cell wall-active antibiotic response 4TMS protein YvqF/B-box zinc finger protein